LLDIGYRPRMKRLFVCAVLVACSGSKTKEEPGTGTGTGTGTGSGVVLTSGGGDAGLMPKIDRTEETKAFFAQWNAADAAEKIHAAAHLRFQQSVKIAELQIFHDDFATLMGPLVRVNSATSSRRQAPDGVIEDGVFGDVTFEKGVVPYEVVFAEDADGKNLKLVNLKMEVPKQFLPEVDRAKARTVAKAAADAILAGDFDRLDGMSLPRLRGMQTPEDKKKLVGLLNELGGGVRLEIVTDEACGETQHCITYHAVGAKPGAGATITLKLTAPMATWRVNDWHFEMDAKK
jgi:hypothetical protein